MLTVVALWWFNVVGPRLRAICNIVTAGNERIVFINILPIVEQSVQYCSVFELKYVGLS